MELVTLVNDACFRHGVTMFDYSSGSAVEVHAPITLQPLPLSTEAVVQLDVLMPQWNKLIDKIARDTTWLLDTLQGSDAEFTGRLLDIFRRTYHERPPAEWGQTLMLGVFRSDYLIADLRSASATSDAVSVHESGHPFRQVEINTISCAFPGLSTRTGLVHRDSIDAALGNHLNVRVSESEFSVVNGLAAAHNEWKSRTGSTTAVVVFLVQAGERNAGDQRILARGLETQSIVTVRRTLAELAEEMEVDGRKNASIVVDGKRIAVSVFYLRSLYDVKDITSEKSWQARETLEICNAVKCPSLPYHLCTWKRVQQALSQYDTLRRFCDSDEMAHALHHCMVKQYLLTSEDDATKKAIASAIADPSKYVMKTQREGTGSLITGADITKMLSVQPTDSEYHRIRSEHLLMERIFARRRPGRVMRRSEVFDIPDLECEIGTFGTVLSDGANMLLNRCAGYLVRTKSGSTEGGGVMSGVAALDTIAIEDRTQ